jgi:hypothetical protein
MARSQTNRFLVRTVRQHCTRRARRHVPLGLEQLERREVLSSSFSYVLNNGNLYQKTSAGETLLDHNVQSYQADGQGHVAILEQSGELKYYSKPNLTPIDSGVTAYHLGGSDVLVELDSQGNYQRYTQATGTVPVDSGVQSFAVASSGRVYLLQKDGTFLGSPDGLPGDFTELDSSAEEFAVAASGRVYVLQKDGTFLGSNDGLPGDFTQIDSGVQAFALAATGRVYILQSDGTFLGSSDGLPGDFKQIDTGVQSIALASTGLIYELENSGLLLSSSTGLAGSFTIAARMVTSISLSNGTLVVNDWFSQNLDDPGVAAEARKEFAADDALTYTDLLAVFHEADVGSTISAAQLQSLQALAANASLLNISAADDDLASKTVNGDPADSHYRGQRLAPLEAGSSSVILKDLVNKWFLGGDLPAAGGSYEAVNDVLFSKKSGPSYKDASQGDLGDCWLIAALAETAARMSSIISSMFIPNGNNTWTVRFYINGVADYVTVDDYLPNGGTFYDNIEGRPMWVALAEKAFAQENASGQLQTSNPGVNSYGALDGGDPAVSLAAVTGLSANDFNVDPSAVGTAWQQGLLIALSTPERPANGSVVPDHCYAVVGFNQTTGAITLFNPWGVNGGYNGGIYYPGFLVVSGSSLSKSFNLITTCGTEELRTESTLDVDPQSSLVIPDRTSNVAAGLSGQRRDSGIIGSAVSPTAADGNPVDALFLALSDRHERARHESDHALALEQTLAQDGFRVEEWRIV